MDLLLVVFFMRSNAVLFMAHLSPGYRGLPQTTLREQSLFIHTTLIVGSLAPRQATAWLPGSAPPSSLADEPTTHLHSTRTSHRRTRTATCRIKLIKYR